MLSLEERQGPAYDARNGFHPRELFDDMITLKLLSSEDHMVFRGLVNQAIERGFVCRSEHRLIPYAD